MAYRLKYYKELISQGHEWRLEIYQDTDESLQTLEIGPVLQGLKLIMQGDQADIDTPIVKTSLEMVFVDAPDLDDDRKCGYWEEFYTSSATEYQIRLLKNGVVEWCGYITPDSFSESLQYRGSVTIIARDNLGALQDFEYDATTDDSGLISLATILNQGLERISFPMIHYYESGGARKNIYCSEAKAGETIFNTLFNNSAFYDKSWNEAIEDVLYATGLVMRYIGKGVFVISSLRDIPLYDNSYWWDVPVLNAKFCAYGNRELSPAVKSVKEEVRFDISDYITDSKTLARAYGEETTYTYGDSFSTVPYIQMPVHAVDSGIFQGAGVDTTILLNPYKYNVLREYGYGKGGEIHNPDVVYVAANLVGGTAERNKRKVGFSISIPPGSYKISLEVNKAIALYNNNTEIGYADYDIEWWRFGYEAVWTGEDGAIKTLNNRAGTDVGEASWGDGASTGYHALSGDSLPMNFESPVLKTDVAGTLVVKLKPADLPNNFSENSKGGYLGIANIAVSAVDNGGYPIMDAIRVKTEFSKKNNIELSRAPKFAPNISNIISVKQIQNAIYVKNNSDIIGSDKWLYHSTDIPQQMAILIHQQILAYYSKPNNVLTGELATENPSFNALYAWNGKNHLLTSGALNIITGRMENVVLREFTRYDHMWETWVETDDVEVDYGATSIQLRVHSNKTITSADLDALPLWLIGSVQSAGNGVYIVSLAVEANSSSERTSIINIDTALVRITQLAPGDYGLDYGEDYS